MSAPVTITKMAQISGLSFAKAIEQHRLEEYHLSTLSKSLATPSWLCKKHNFLHKETKELNSLSTSIATAKFVENKYLLSIPLDGSLKVPVNFKDKFAPGTYPSKITTPAIQFGQAKEKSFHLDFVTSLAYHTVFAKQGYVIVPTKDLYHIENFGGISGFTVRSQPDFEVRSSKDNKLIGFIEYKARTCAPTQYNNYYNRDIMQTSLYSLIKNGTTITDLGNNPRGTATDFPKRTRVWIIQNYDDSKFLINEISSVAPKVVAGMTNQLHRIISDVNKSVRFDAVQNTTSQEYLYSRKDILRHIIQSEVHARYYLKKGVHKVKLEDIGYTKPTVDHSRDFVMSAPATPFVPTIVHTVVTVADVPEVTPETVPASPTQICLEVCMGSSVGGSMSSSMSSDTRNGTPLHHTSFPSRHPFKESVGRCDSVTPGIATSITHSIATGITHSIATGIATSIALEWCKSKYSQEHDKVFQCWKVIAEYGETELCKV